MPIAKLAVDRHLPLLRQDAVDFLPPQHAQHVGHPRLRTGAAKIRAALIEQTQVKFVKQAAYHLARRQGQQFRRRDGVRQHGGILPARCDLARMTAILRDSLNQQAGSPLLVGREIDACFDLLGALHVGLKGRAQQRALDRHHTLIGRLALARIKRDGDLAVADHAGQRVAGNGGWQRPQFRRRAHRKVRIAFHHHQANRGIRCRGLRLQHQGAFELDA